MTLNTKNQIFLENEFWFIKFQFYTHLIIIDIKLVL